MKFKILDKVKGKYTFDNWDGYIDAITPQGKIRVKVKEGYKWVNECDIEYSDGSKNPKENNPNKFNYL